MVCGGRRADDGDEANTSGCGNELSPTPGKIHKLYRRLLNQLEFRCPNGGHGCPSTLRYEQIDQHLRQECDFREVACPNGCCSGQDQPLMFVARALQTHLDKDCQKQQIKCPQNCGRSIPRGDMR